MGDISFNGIAVGIRTPGSYVEFSNVRASRGLAIQPRVILVLGQKLAGGSQAPLVPVRVFNPLDGQALFGRGSMLDRIIQRVLTNNPSTETWAIAEADNAAGAAATYTHTITGPATAAGTLAFYIGGQEVQVAVTSGEAATAIATALAAAINANADLPETATVAGAVVTTTCRWKGLTGNDIDHRLNYSSSDLTPAGVTLTTAVGTAGAANPDITAAITAMGDKWYNTIVNPWTDSNNLTALATEMATRRGGMVMHDGLVYSATKGSLGTIAAFGATLNSPDFSISEAVGPVTTWERAAGDAGVIDFNVGIDPARPLQTLPIAGDVAPNQTERFARQARDTLLHDGISTHKVDTAGNVCLERPITTYQLNSAGSPDPSYLDVTTMATLGYLRYTLRVRWDQKFPRMKLADDGIAVSPGQAIVTPSTLRAELIALARDWESAGLVENIDEFKSLLIVQRNSSDPSRVDAIIPPDIVSGLRVFAAQIQFAF